MFFNLIVNNWSILGEAACISQNDNKYSIVYLVFNIQGFVQPPPCSNPGLRWEWVLIF